MNECVISETSIASKQFICEICQKSFFTKLHYQIHSIVHFVPKHFDCDNCQEGLAFILDFNKHLELHNNAIPVICHVCKKEFLDDVSLNEHIKIHTSESNALILQQDPANEEISIIAHNDEKNALSNNDGSNKKSVLVENTSKDDLQNIFRCEICKKEFLEKNNYDDHYRNQCVKKQDSVSIKLAVDNLQMPINNNGLLIVNPLGIIKNIILFKNPGISESAKTFSDKKIELKDEKEDVSPKNAPKIKQFICSVCQKIFLDEFSLTNHISSHANEKSFTCYLCEKKFPFYSLLDAHVQAHNVNKFKCGVCQTGFDSKDKLFDHVHIHAMVNVFSCNICQKTFSEKILLDNHHRLCHIPEKVFTREFSQQKYSSEKLLNLHSKPSDNKICSDRVCDICSKSFTKPYFLRQHYRIHTGEKPFKCDSCGASFTQKYSLTKHQRRHQFNKGICKPCNLCPKEYVVKSSSNSQFCIHFEKPFKCKVCEKGFASRSGLSYHQSMHNEQKSYVCDICKKNCRRRINLVLHQHLHAGEKLFKCEFCRISFSQKTTLTEHQLACGKNFATKKTFKNNQSIYSGIKPFMCDICKKSFSSRNNFASHRRVHLGVKPYLCEACGKAFARKDNLKIHSFTHQEQKPFKCDVCQKTFAFSSTLKTHLLIHTGEKPFMCDVCGRRFTQKQQMNRHLQCTHKKEKPFKCDLCSRRFSQKSTLKHHLQFVHKKGSISVDCK